MMSNGPWSSYWGSRFPAQRVIPLFVVASLLLALVPLALAWLGVAGPGEWLARGADAEAVSQARAVVHLLLNAGAALLALVTVLFAGGRGAMSRDPEAYAVSALMFFVFLLECLHAHSGWAHGDLALAEVESWTLPRLVLALGLLLGLYVIGPNRVRWVRSMVTVNVVGIAGLLAWWAGSQGAAFPRLLFPEQVITRPFDLAVLVLILFAGGLAWWRFWRGLSTLLGLGITLATVPQVIAQLLVITSTDEQVGTTIALAHYETVVGYGIMLGGLLLDYLASIRQGETAQIHLTQQTLRLEQTGEALARQTEEREKAERTLRMLKNAVETMNLGVSITDTQGALLYVNPAEARMHGYAVEEVIGKHGRLFATAAEPELLPPTTSGEQVFVRERLNRTREGKLFPVRLVSSWVTGATGELEGLVTLCEDISDRRRSEEALDRRERVLEAVGLAAERFLSEAAWEQSVAEVLERLGLATGVDLVSMVSLEVESLREVPTFNYRWTAPGYTRRHLDVTHWRSLVQRAVFARWPVRLAGQRVVSGQVSELPPNERTVLEARSIRSFVAVAITVGGPVRGLLTFESTDESREWATAELEALRTAARALGAAFQRQETEKALASSEVKYRALLESANDMIQSVTPDGRFEFVNRAWCEMMGYRRDEVERLEIWDVVHPRFHPHCEDLLRKTLSGQDIYRLEVVFVTKSGKEVAVEGSVTSRIESGSRVATLGIFRDVSERLRIDRIKSEFISTVSHELRTPLTSIIAALGLLDSGRLSDQADRVRELVAVAHRNSLRLLQLINDLLDLQKLTAGKMNFDLRPFGVGAVMTEALKGMQAFADSRHVRLVMGEVDPGLRVVADEARLIQVFNNLLSNAVKFSPSGGEVQIGAVRHGARAVLAVRDYGPGIPSEFQQRLFDQFTQFDSSTTRAAGGSGLGLSIVKRLVEAMGGTVACESEPGAGAIFFVDLPRAPGEGETTVGTGSRSLRAGRGFAEGGPAAEGRSAREASDRLLPE